MSSHSHILFSAADKSKSVMNGGVNNGQAIVAAEKTGKIAVQELPLNCVEARADDVEDELDAILPPAFRDLRRRWAALDAEMAARGVVLGPPVACALGDRLRDAAEEGDVEAAALLRQAVPTHMPAVVRRAWRDQRIRDLADRVQSAVPNLSISAAANIVAAAGTALATIGRIPRERPVSVLDLDEIEALKMALVDMQTMSRAKWPGKRRIRDIILKSSD